MTCVQTQTRGTLQLDTMAGYNPAKHNRAQATASGFKVPNGSSFRGMPSYSLPKTEPTHGDHNGQFWNGTGEAQQNLHQETISPQGDVHSGVFDNFSSFNGLPGQDHTRGSFSSSTKSLWSSELASTHLESQAMTRFPSQDSIGAHSQRSTNSFDPRMYPNVSQMSIHMSSASSDTARSNSPDDFALYTPTQMDLQAFDTFPYAGDEFTGVQPSFHRNSNVSITSQPISTGGQSYSLFATAEDDSFPSLTASSATLMSHGPASRDSMVYNPSSITDTSSTLWDETEFLESQRSSPALLEEWAMPGQIMNSNTNSPLEYSPSLEGLSPRYVEDFPDLVDLPPYTTGDRAMRKPVGPRPSKVASDLAAASRRPRLPGSESSEESFKLVGRSSLEMDNTAREHPLYHNAVPQADGLYHCPWEKEPGSSCQHKPEKLKCNYDKFVDSHLKPYRCKIPACKDLHFSSTACLLRHEREAHAMHGHGDKPFLCTYDGCERGVSGNGFPRHWNLRDHMKRVHNDPGQPKSNASGSPPPSGSVKGKKRKASETQETKPVAPKRVSTPPVVIRQPREPSLIERYRERQLMLLNTVKQLQDPRHAENMTLLRNANDCIKVMVQTTQRINSAPNTSPPSG